MVADLPDFFDHRFRKFLTDLVFIQQGRDICPGFIGRSDDAGDPHFKRSCVFHDLDHGFYIIGKRKLLDVFYFECRVQIDIRTETPAFLVAEERAGHISYSARKDVHDIVSLRCFFDEDLVPVERILGIGFRDIDLAFRVDDGELEPGDVLDPADHILIIVDPYILHVIVVYFPLVLEFLQGSHHFLDLFCVLYMKALLDLLERKLVFFFE